MHFLSTNVALYFFLSPLSPTSLFFLLFASLSFSSLSVSPASLSSPPSPSAPLSPPSLFLSLSPSPSLPLFLSPSLPLPLSLSLSLSLSQFIDPSPPLSLYSRHLPKSQPVPLFLLCQSPSQSIGIHLFRSRLSLHLSFLPPIFFLCSIPFSFLLSPSLHQNTPVSHTFQ